MADNRLFFQVPLLTLTAILVAGVAHAKTDIVPYVELRQSVGENVTQNDGFGAVSIVTAGISARTQQQRVEGTLDYNIEQRWALKGTISDKLRHNFIGRGRAELMPDFVYLDAGGAITRLARDLRGPLTTNPDAENINMEEVYTFFVTPSIEKRIFGDALLNVNYTLSYTDFQEPNGQIFAAGAPGSPNPSFNLGREGQSWSHSGSASISDYLLERKLHWTLLGSVYREDREQLDGRSDSQRLNLDLAYSLSRTWALLGSIGYEDLSETQDNLLVNPLTDEYELVNGEFQRDPVTPRRAIYDEAGLTWDVGFRYTPSQRMDLTIRGGERYGEVSFSGNLFYQPTRHVTINAMYSESIDTTGRLLTQRIGDVTTSNLLQGGGQMRIGGGCFLRDPFTGDCLFFQSVTNASFRNQSFLASAEYENGRNRLGLRFIYDSRRYLTFNPLEIPGQAPVPPNLAGEEDKTAAVYLDYNRTISDRSNASLGTFFSRSSFALTQNRDDNFYGVTAGYYYRFTDTITGRINGFWSERDSNQQVGFADSGDMSATVAVRASF